MFSAAVAGAGANAIGNWMGNNAAEKKYKEAWKKAQQYLQPYADFGKAQGQNLTDAAGNLLDPEALQNKWATGYTESPYAKQTASHAAASGLESASQQGLLGSSAALNNVQSSSSNIMNADRQQYLNDLMQKYMTGIQTSQNLYNTGATASNQLAGFGMKTGDNLAQTGYNKWAGTGQAFSDLMGQYYGRGGGGGLPTTPQNFNEYPEPY